MKNSSSALASNLEGFFIERLMNQKRVSKETVLEMARGVRKELKADIGHRTKRQNEFISLVKSRSRRNWSRKHWMQATII